MANKPKKGEEEGIQAICRNRKALHEYEIHDRLECGIVLKGTEVKSLREQSANLEESYAKVEDGEVWLLGCDIPEYSRGNRLNHKPKRAKKLLLHKREISKFVGKATQRGFTLIPLRMYFKNGIAKLELAIARGKQLYDKRQAQKKADANRDIRRELATRRKR